MNSAVKIIKRGKNEILAEVPAGQDERTGPQSTREMVRTVKGWIAELHRRRRDEERNNSVFGRFRVTLSLIMLCFWAVGTESNGQQLRDAFRRVEPAVVMVRTEQKGLAPFPQQGMVSLNGLGSGVLISNDGKVLTAAHLVQAADRTVVEFSRGELIPARVTGSAFSADVAVLQLEHNPVNAVAATLGDSDKVDVGDQIFVVWGIQAGKLRANVEGEEFILGGDIILRVNEVPVEQSGSYDEIYASIGRLKPGDNLVISVFRRGQTIKLSIPTTQ